MKMLNREDEGRRVKLLHTSDRHTRLRPGDLGTVQFTDDMGTLFVNWDEGSSLGLVPGEDSFTFIEDEHWDVACWCGRADGTSHAGGVVGHDPLS